MHHVMVDVETLGLEPYAAIISIGAVSMVRGATPGHFLSEFYTTITIQSNLEAKMLVDPKTVQWWINGDQDAGAKAALKFEHRLDLALEQFSVWYRLQESEAVWGNGSSFDVVLLEAAYESVHLKAPWGFRDHRCFRTMRSEFPQVPRVEPLVAHDALSDAKAQAEQLQNIWSLIDVDSP